MSELKAIKSGEIYNIIEYEDCYRTDDLYYPKAEADKVIADKDKEIAELKEQYKDMDVTHAVHIAEMNAKIEEQENCIAELKAKLEERDKEIAKLNEEYTIRLEPYADDDDFEVAHSRADDLLCKLLRKLGFDSVVDAYDKVGKYYA